MAYNPLRHLGLKALSVAIAAMLWIAVGGEKVVERSLRSPLELENTPEGLELVGETPGNVDVRVRGSSSALGQLSAGDVVTVLDLSTARAGRKMFHLTPNHVRVPFGVEVTYAGPATVTLMFERSMAKTVPVVPSVEGLPAPGYAVDRIVADPAEVEVLGPESALRDVQQATTETLEVGGATVSVNESVNIGLPNSAARLRTPRSARVLIEISPVRTERSIAAVPVRMKNLLPSQSARSVPPTVTVTVRGAEDALARLKDDSIEASVDLMGLGAGRYNLAVRVAPSTLFGIVHVQPVQVQIEIR